MERQRTHKQNKIIIAIMLIVAYSAAIVFSCSCASKKYKQIEKTETNIQKTEEQNEENNLKTETNSELTEVKATLTENISTQENFQGEIHDTTKDATVIVENLDGKKMYRYRNFKNVKTESSTSKVDESQQIETKTAETQTTTSQTHQVATKTAATKEKTTKNLKTKTPDIKNYLYPLITIALIIFLIRYIKKRML